MSYLKEKVFAKNLPVKIEFIYSERSESTR